MLILSLTATDSTTITQLHHFSLARKVGQIEADKSIRVRIVFQTNPVNQYKSTVMRISYMKKNSLETVDEIVQPDKANKVWQTYLPKSGTVSFEAVEIKPNGATWSSLGPVDLSRLNKAISFSMIQKLDGSYNARIDKN